MERQEIDRLALPLLLEVRCRACQRSWFRCDETIHKLILHWQVLPCPDLALMTYGVTGLIGIEEMTFLMMDLLSLMMVLPMGIEMDLLSLMSPTWDEELKVKMCGQNFSGQQSVKGHIIVKNGVKESKFYDTFGDGPPSSRVVRVHRVWATVHLYKRPVILLLRWWRSQGAALLDNWGRLS